jgi:hypothetical protein
MSRRAIIPPRRRIFVGCEGESERGYATFLSQRLREQYDLHIAMNTEVLRPGGGDPLALVQLAVQKIARNERNHGPYQLKAIQLDSDRLGADPARDRQMRELAAQENVRLIFQEPCHEGFLLRHLEGCAQHRPPTAAIAVEALRREWPAYQKAMAAREIAQRISDAGIWQAYEVEQELREFLTDLGLRRRRNI